jgi:predicted glycosyltransferase
MRWLTRYYGGEARQRVQRLYRPGGINDGVIFWQRDIEGRVRTGKIMFYDEWSGKRLKEEGSIGWVHAVMRKEGELPEELKPYLLKTPYELVHHVLAFAKLVYSEGATMASEAVVLGTHALYVNTIVSGSTREPCERFHLLYNFNVGEDRYEKATAQAIELLENPNLVELGREKQKKLLS